MACRISLSIFINVAWGVVDRDEWSLTFLSYHKLYSVAWITKRRRVVGHILSLKSDQARRAVHVWNRTGLYPKRFRTRVHTCSLKLQRRKRWSLVSAKLLHMQQEVSTCWIQVAMRVLVGRRSKFATHVMKAWLGMWPLNQTMFSQPWGVPWWRKESQVSRAE